jgi:hypothetical protein
MRLHRKDPLLNEAIAALDTRLAEAKRQLPKANTEDQTSAAWSLLSSVELEFVRGEMAQCIDDRVYYLGNYHVIQPEMGILTCLDPLYDHQQMIEDALVRNLRLDGQSRIITLKPRQSGLTEYCTGVMCWRTFFVPHAYTISVAQAPDVAAHIQRKVSISWDHLPWWMRPERQYHTKGEFMEYGRKDISVRTIDPGLGSVFVTTHAQRETGVAIGRTVRSLHMSEVSRWPSGEVYTGDIEPSMNASDTIGFAESTAFGNEGFFYNLWEEASEGDSDWTPVFLPAYRARKYSLPLRPSQLPFTLTKAEKSFTERVKKEEGIRITNEFWNWRRRRIKSSIARTGFSYAHMESYPIVAQEAFQSSGQGAFPRHKLDEQQQANVCNPIWVGEIGYQGMNAAPKLFLNHMLDADGNYKDIALEKRELTNRFYLWEMPDPREAYYAAFDVGDGIAGGDFPVGEVMRAGHGNNPDVQVGEWVGYEPPIAFAKVAYAIGFFFNRCEIAVEYKGEGMTTANELMNVLEYPNIYRPRNDDRLKGQFAAYMHWQTTSKTKPLLLVRMNETLLEDQIIIRSQYLLDELRRCVKDGITFSGLGGHDDAAVAACIALYCLRQTMPELRVQATSGDAQNQTPDRGARVTGGAVIYGLYDQLFRLRGQTPDLSKAQAFVEKNPGYQIKTIIVSKANTAYSPIHHGTGIESELYKQHGMNPWDITPQMVTTLAEATGRLTQNGLIPRPGGVAVPGSQLGARVEGGDADYWSELGGTLGGQTEL